MKQQTRILLLASELFSQEESLKLADKLFEITLIKYIPIHVPNFSGIIKCIEI